jgi:hypothetical protein
MWINKLELQKLIDRRVEVALAHHEREEHRVITRVPEVRGEGQKLVAIDMKEIVKSAIAQGLINVTVQPRCEETVTVSIGEKDAVQD